MTIRSSGALPASEINTELGLSSTAQISLGGAVPRALAGVASGAVRLAADFYGKSNGPSGNLATIDFATSGHNNYYQILTLPTWTWGTAVNFTSTASYLFSYGGGGYLQCVNEGPSGTALIMCTTTNASSGQPELRSIVISGSGSNSSFSGIIYAGGNFPNLCTMPSTIAYGNGLWVGYTRLGSGWQHITSSNGINWTLTASGLGTGTLSLITWTGSEFLGHNPNTGTYTVYASTNGTSWSTRGSITSGGFGVTGGTAYGNGVYIAVSASGGAPGNIFINRSTNNGASFSSTTLSPAVTTNTNGQAQVRYCGGNNWVIWCGGGSYNGVSYTSSDNGASWSSPNKATWTGDNYTTNLRMIGNGSTVIVPIGGNNIKVSMDAGVTWKVYTITTGTPQNIPWIYFK
jgi:hypothetical protein